jgi:hypothetical protein
MGSVLCAAVRRFAAAVLSLFSAIVCLMRRTLRFFASTRDRWTVVRSFATAVHLAVSSLVRRIRRVIGQMKPHNNAIANDDVYDFMEIGQMTPDNNAIDSDDVYDFIEATPETEEGLRFLFLMQPSAIVRPVTYEKIGDRFKITNPSTRYAVRFTISLQNVRASAETILKTLQLYDDKGYTIQNLDETCLLRSAFLADGPVLIGQLAGRLRKRSSDEEPRLMMNALGRLLRRNLPTEGLDPLLADLCDHLVSTSPQKYRTLDGALRHPYFWSGEERVTFAGTAYNFLFGRPLLMQRFDQDTTQVVGNWKVKVDRHLLNDPEGKPGAIYSTKMSDLLRLIRNKSVHLAKDENHVVLPIFRTSDDEYFAYFHQRFGQLLLHTLHFIENAYNE